ncbi:MAG: hypothetical protein HRU03_08195 [Nanoarchaeales archaeon]|nr:hypothetical protein [Nanoarchaeales archaeon]
MSLVSIRKKKPSVKIKLGETLENEITRWIEKEGKKKKLPPLMSINGLHYLIKELIGRDVIDEEFKGVRVEENLEHIISIGKKKLKLSKEEIFSGFDPETINTLTGAKKTDGLKSNSINYVTNKTSSKLFLNIQKSAKLKNEDFDELAYQSLKNSIQTKLLLSGLEYNIFKLLDNVDTISNAKNSTKTTEITVIEYEPGKYKFKVEVTPITGIKLVLPVIHWNLGMYRFFFENAENIDVINSKSKINDLRRSWTYEGSFELNKEYKAKNRIWNRFSKKLIDNKLEILKLESEKIEYLKINKMQEVEYLYGQTKTLMESMPHPPTSDHENIVTYKALIMAVQLGVSTKHIRNMMRGVPNHDIAKGASPDQILGKKKDFTDMEYVIMQNHAPGSEELMIRAGLSLEESRIGSEHQTNFNGTAYPAVHPIRDESGNIIDTRTPRGDEISLTGYIVRFVDGFDALLYRFYDKTRSIDDVLEIFERDNKNGIFHPLIGRFGIDEFSQTLKDIGYSRSRYNSNIEIPISAQEEKLMKFCLGYENTYSAYVNPETRKLVDTHVIDYGTKEDRITCLGLNLKQTYNKLDDTHKEMLKSGIPNNMKRFIPVDQIPYI